MDVAAAAVASAPINLTASVSGNTVSLAWAPPAVQDLAVSSYVVDAGSTPDFSAPNLASFDTRSTSTSLTVPGVPAGTYYVRVRAGNALGLGPPSNEVAVVVGGMAANVCPGPPRSLTATRSATGLVTLVWLAPGFGTVHSYLVEAGSSTGLSDIARVNVAGTGVSFPSSTVPSGVYYLRVSAQTAGCPISAPSNEVRLVVPGPTGGNPEITLTLSYSCGPCTGDPDNYSLNVACVGGRCTTFRTSNPFRSNVITGRLRLAPGTYETEVVARNSTWNLTITSAPGGGVEPGSFVLLYPPTASALSFGRCGITGRTPEAVFTFRVRVGGPVC
jgi:hypothetical protein